VETINAWMIRIFWLAVGRWAGRAGNDERAAAFVETLLERIVASIEQTPA